MGQCLSSSGSRRAASEEPTAQAGVYDRLIHPPVPAAHGSQAVVSQAKVSSDGSPAVPLLVRTTPHHVFVALFEGLGEDRRSVAAFCRARALETYQEAAAAHPDSPLEALKDTLARLDAAVLASDRLKPAVGGWERPEAAGGTSLVAWCWVCLLVKSRLRHGCPHPPKPLSTDTPQPITLPTGQGAQRRLGGAPPAGPGQRAVLLRQRGCCRLPAQPHLRLFPGQGARGLLPHSRAHHLVRTLWGPVHCLLGV